MSTMKITESEKNKILDLYKKPQTDINEVSLNPRRLVGYIFNGLKNIFKSADDALLDRVSNNMAKTIKTLVKSTTKNVTIKEITKTPAFQKSFSDLAESVSKSKYDLPFGRLLPKEQEKVLKEVSKNLETVITKELQKATNVLTNVDFTKLKAAQSLNVGKKTSQITKAIEAIKKTDLTKASSFVKQNAKLVSSNGGFKVFQINTTSLKGLGKIVGVGSVGLIAYHLIKEMYPNDDIAVIDENNKDVTN
jgi:hypothetical protein